MAYVRKSVPVEAYRFGTAPVPVWVTAIGKIELGFDYPVPAGRSIGDPDFAIVQTLNGRRKFSRGSWLIKEPDGEIKDMSNTEFQAKYQVVP